MSWKRKGVLSKVFPARTNIQQRVYNSELLFTKDRYVIAA